jgi:hypothetical protein
VAETVTPAVRGYRKLTVALLQITAGSLSAILVQTVLGRALRSAGLAPSLPLAVSLSGAAGTADLLFLLRRRPRPLAWQRQVPRHWGHVHGPWRAAVRYAVRMGVGPTTILTTWTWWAALVLCSASGSTMSALGAFVFVAARFTASSAATVGVADGTAMAFRARRLDGLARPVEMTVIAMSGALAVGLAASMAFR